MIGDVKEMLVQMQAPVDAWFLDGFAPGLNACMWSAYVFKQIKRLSQYGTTFSTYTAVGDVRRGLMQVGFTVSKVSGCGKKRHMLAGKFESEPQSIPSTQPWYEGSATFTRSRARLYYRCRYCGFNYGLGLRKTGL